MTVMMADHGAKVIKVEPQTGDPARVMEPRTSDGGGAFYQNYEAKTLSTSYCEGAK